jgi:hypothetical protein
MCSIVLMCGGVLLVALSVAIMDDDGSRCFSYNGNWLWLRLLLLLVLLLLLL